MGITNRNMHNVLTPSFFYFFIFLTGHHKVSSAAAILSYTSYSHVLPPLLSAFLNEDYQILMSNSQISDTSLREFQKGRCCIEDTDGTLLSAHITVFTDLPRVRNLFCTTYSARIHY